MTSAVSVTPNSTAIRAQLVCLFTLTVLCSLHLFRAKSLLLVAPSTVNAQLRLKTLLVSASLAAAPSLAPLASSLQALFALQALRPAVVKNAHLFRMFPHFRAQHFILLTFRRSGGYNTCEDNVCVARCEAQLGYKQYCNADNTSCQCVQTDVGKSFIFWAISFRSFVYRHQQLRCHRKRLPRWLQRTRKSLLRPGYVFGHNFVNCCSICVQTTGLCNLSCNRLSKVTPRDGMAPYCTAA